MKPFRNFLSILLSTCGWFICISIACKGNAQPTAPLSSPVASIVNVSCASSFSVEAPLDSRPSEFQTAIAEFDGGPLQGVTLFDLFRLGLIKAQSAESIENLSTTLRRSSPLEAWAVHGLYYFENSDFLFVLIPNPTELISVQGPATVHIFAKTIEGQVYSSKRSIWASGTSIGQDAYGNIQSFFAGRPGYWMSPKVEFEIFPTPAKVISFQVFSSQTGLGLEGPVYSRMNLTIKPVRVHQNKNQMVTLKPIQVMDAPLTFMNPEKVRELIRPVLSVIEIARNR